LDFRKKAANKAEFDVGAFLWEARERSRRGGQGGQRKIRGWREHHPYRMIANGGCASWLMQKRFTP